MIKKLLFTTALLSSCNLWAEVTIDTPFARAVPPGQLNSAAFMELHNHGDNELSLVGASSPVAEHVELHTHTNDNGVMRMRQIEKITLPKETTVSLKPGGLHIMLIGLQESLNVGKVINLSLQFSDGTTDIIEVPVKHVTPMKKHHKMHKMGPKSE